MKEEIEQLLPLIKIGKVSEIDIQHITDRIRLAIKQDPSKGKELGEFLSRIKQASKVGNLSPELNWVQVGNGYLAIGHKPGGKVSFEGLRNEGTTAVLTLLNENEGALQIGKQVNAVNIKWIWFPFSASNPHAGESINQVNNLFHEIATILESAGRVYIHCSAGIHRTGMISYGFLRFLGIGKMEAFNILKTLREVTAAQVGEDRLHWADQFSNGSHRFKIKE